MKTLKVAQHDVTESRDQVQSTDHEKIPATNSIYAHAQHFAMHDELPVAMLKTSVPQQVNK